MNERESRLNSTNTSENPKGKQRRPSESIHQNRRSLREANGKNRRTHQGNYSNFISPAKTEYPHGARETGTRGKWLRIFAHSSRVGFPLLCCYSMSLLLIQKRYIIINQFKGEQWFPRRRRGILVPKNAWILCMFLGNGERAGGREKAIKILWFHSVLSRWNPLFLVLCELMD